MEDEAVQARREEQALPNRNNRCILHLRRTCLNLQLNRFQEISYDFTFGVPHFHKISLASWSVAKCLDPLEQVLEANLKAEERSAAALGQENSKLQELTELLRVAAQVEL